jgi:alkylhydroperoxidase family enzyme
VTEQQLRDLGRYRDSDAFSEDERLVLDLAVQMAETPVAVPDELLDRLRRLLGEPALVELVAAIAWENYRARFNRPFGVGPVGFSEGAVCAVPEAAHGDRP